MHMFNPRCPNCGAVNQHGYESCVYCNDANPAYSPDKQAMVQGARSTRGAIYFLMISLALSWIPYIGVISLIFGAIGAVGIIRNRATFGGRHSFYTILSATIFIVSFVSVFIMAFLFVTDVMYFSNRGTLNTFTLTSQINGLLFGAATAGFMTMVSYALMLLDLQSRRVKVLSFVALAVQAVVIVLTTSALAVFLEQNLPDYTGLAFLNASAFSITGTQPDGLGVVQLLNIIPVSMLLVSYYMVTLRINRGEIPAEMLESPASSEEF